MCGDLEEDDTELQRPARRLPASRTYGDPRGDRSHVAAHAAPWLTVMTRATTKAGANFPMRRSIATWTGCSATS